jgi:putative ABC transport system permease protein
LKLKELFIYSFNGLIHRKSKSWLIVVGIVVGIAAVVSLLTLGQNFREEVNKQLSALGTNTVFITPTSSGPSFGIGILRPTSGKLYDKDVDRIKRIPEIEAIARLLSSRTTVTFNNKSITAQISGLEPGVFEKTAAIKIAEGRFLQEGDKRVVVIGDNIANNAFGSKNKISVNSYITIKDTKYRVIGILEKSGGASFGPGNTDNGIYIPFTEAREMFKTSIAPNEILGIVLRIKEGFDTNEVVEKIKFEMDASHKVKPDERDYSIVDPATIQKTVENVLFLLTLFIGAVAAISLLVGGLAIASSMFTSVIERTKEIGILKAVGAKNSDILKIFVFEAGLIGAIGGIIGDLVGIGIIFVASYAGFPASVNIGILLFGILFAFLVGVLSGYFPAKNAAQMQPVNALRYE